MKSKRRILTILIVVAIIVMIGIRLAANKRSFDKELKMVSEFNATIPVLVDTVQYRNFNSGFSVSGNFEPARELSIAAEISGKILAVNAETGKTVNAGEVLASTDNVLLKSQYELAGYTLEKAHKDLDRFEQLSKADAATTQQYESARQTFINAQSALTAAKEQYDNSFIKAPFDGIITKRYIEKGTYLQPGTNVFDMMEITTVKFIAKLSADETSSIQKGQTVKVNVDSYPGILYSGKVSGIVVKADASKRYDVEIDVVNRKDKLIKPGMFGTAIFEGHSGEQQLTIPRKAITGSIKNPEVFVVKGDSVTAKSIDAASINDKYIAVKQGLKAGDVIVVSGQINLVNGSKIKLNQ